MEILELVVDCEHLDEQLAVLVDELLPLFVVARILDELLGGSLSQTMSDISNSHCSAPTKWRERGEVGLSTMRPSSLSCSCHFLSILAFCSARK